MHSEISKNTMEPTPTATVQPTTTPTPVPPTATSTPAPTATPAPVTNEWTRVTNLHGGTAEFLRKRLLGNI